MTEKIAILTDSGSDVPPELVKELGIFVVPLQVNYKDKSYRDGVDIDAQTVYNNLRTEVPSTSLPRGEDVSSLFETIKAQGYTHILGVVLSAGLSGTCNLLRLMAAESPLPMVVMDTKNIGIGSGMSVIKAAQLVKEGMGWDKIQEVMPGVIANTKVYFSLNTLEYLEKGGRIGKVTALLGYALDLKPIITCNEEGIYTTVTKARGRKVSLNRLIETALKFLEGCEDVTISVAHGDALDEGMAIKEAVAKRYPNAKLYFGPVSPALGVHTGPGLIGIAVQRN